jgi:hypothetical protein
VSWLDAEVERVLDPAYRGELTTRSLEELHSLRSECQQVEVAVSYLRRMAQGRMDVIGAYLSSGDHRGSAVGSDAELERLVEELPRIIAGPPRPQGFGHLPSPFQPDTESPELTKELDEAFAADALVSLGERTPDQLREALEKISQIEAKLSAQRKRLHELIDSIQAEIVARYKSGKASTEGLLG